MSGISTTYSYLECGKLEYKNFQKVNGTIITKIVRQHFLFWFAEKGLKIEIRVAELEKCNFILI